MSSLLNKATTLAPAPKWNVPAARAGSTQAQAPGVAATKDDEEDDSGVTYTAPDGANLPPPPIAASISGLGGDPYAYNPYTNAGGTHDAATTTGVNTDPNQPATPPANTETDNLVNSLKTAVESGQNVVTQNIQAQATQATNLGRLQAGANTLGGNYAASGAAGAGNEAKLGQQLTQNAGLSASQAGEDLQSTYGSALNADTTEHQQQQQQTMDAQTTQISDEIAQLQQKIKGATDAQSLQLSKYLADLTEKVNTYKNAVASGQADFNVLVTLFGTLSSSASSIASVFAGQSGGS